MPDVRITVYGQQNCEATSRTRKHLDELGTPYTFVDIDKDEKASENVKRWNHGKSKTPTVEFTVGEEVYRIAEPDNDALDQELEINGLLPKKTA